MQSREVPKCLTQEHNKELVNLYPLLMLNVKLGSCENQLLKFFGLTRP